MKNQTQKEQKEQKKREREYIQDIKRRLEIEESQVAALNATLAEYPLEIYRLIDIIGLDATLKLMVALPNVTIKIPNAEIIPDSINVASATLAVVQRKMKVKEAAMHYQVNEDRLRKAASRLRKHYEDKAKYLAKVRFHTQKLEIKRMFNYLERGELPNF